MADEPVTASAQAIQNVFGVPARTVRRWGKDGLVDRPARGQYRVKDVLTRYAERDLGADSAGRID